MSNVFIGGIPASGKSYLAKRIADKIGTLHLNIDTLRKEMSNDPKLKYWVDFFFNQDEENYLKETSCEIHWQNLVKQSEAFWPTIIKRVNEVLKTHPLVIVEGINLLPHLVNKDFNFPGIYLLGESFDQIFERNKQNPRWGKTEGLQKSEAELFYNCERPKIKNEAEKYGYKVFDNCKVAETEVFNLLKNE